ncbi:LOW QUALITY PROTEIN: uncharacterized protein LOC129319757 [Prosopis cineraria]|uniref:LOW QUALITY PROTEIN: uncharacterized protein LOC129319757 n=1 Tax=Prosopis cineraria TaxID=364024 RepID=UPI00240EAFD3|nr:LOW QUALITY PROTEIN: uncharacterized protein LOC129319757 [Prosopis cineraria]
MGHGSHGSTVRPAVGPNAEDNHYNEGVNPTLEFIITSKDITATRAPATLLILNNEKGFSPKNIESICSVGRSTKKGNRRSGYIGEKGIGFKSVFLITTTPYIFSNGYQIRFNEEPCQHCGLGYIVPEWVEENPTLEEIEQICGGDDSRPTTIIIFPLKPDKVGPVKQQLSNIHPEVLLFLSKIKRLSVREDNEDPRLNTVTAIAISSEINFMTRKNMNAKSYTLCLSSEENGDSEKECMYHMWRQRFPVRPENRVERRMDVEEWVVTLAFPNQERLHRGRSSPGIYAFLPTEMVTNFPFIIQADFVLASSRETILLDDKWNQGILNCIPSAFMDAFKSLVISPDPPISSLIRFFQFLPLNISSYQELNDIRDEIKAKVVEESIVPSETYSKQKHFYKPREVGRLLPAFWDVLTKAKEQGVHLGNLSSHGSYILHSSFDQVQFDHILDFLGVQLVSHEWYAKCIQSSNLVLGVSEDAYLQLLLFIAENWGSRIWSSNMKFTPLIKCVRSDGNLSCFDLDKCERSQGSVKILLADPNQSCPISWLISWNREFSCAGNHYFMPETTQEAIQKFPRKQTLLGWLGKEINFSTVGAYDYANLICHSIGNKCNHALAYSHFLYHSFLRQYLSRWQVDDLCKSMPLVDNYGRVSTCREGVLVPAKESKWADLIVSNPWRDEGYVELKEDYLYSYRFAGQYTYQGRLIDFLKTHVGACDIPHISPPNASFSAVNNPLTKENAFLVLDWIQNLKYRGILPERFLKSVREGSWLKVTINGYRPPSKSFLVDSTLRNLLQNRSVLVDIPVVDQIFYGKKLDEYEDELKTIGVMFSYKEACAFIGKELMSRAASFTLSRVQVLSMLQFIRYLRQNHFPSGEFVSSIKNGRWLKTCYDYRSPDRAILYDSEWEIASQISNLPFIDDSYYGNEIYNFKEELQLLGVMVGFCGRYQLVIDHLKSSYNLINFTAEAIILILECMHFSNVSGKLVSALQGSNCLMTSKGFKAPRGCYLSDPVWGCILEVFNISPVIDHNFYGNKIMTYKDELKRTGVVVDFEDAIEAFGAVFKLKASQASLTKQHVESFLFCYRHLKEAQYAFPSSFLAILRTVEWLRTRLGAHKPPKDCILFGPAWESLSAITRLPFIDDSDNFYGKGISEYKEELKSMGVAIEVKDGLKLISAGLRFPSDPSSITPENVFSLLECIRLMQERPQSFDDFGEQLSRKWLKTQVGYETPKRCLLFDSQWKLEPMDGPFIDETFYGSKITSYKKELIAIGVISSCHEGLSVMAGYLSYHSNFSTIVRIYKYLSKYDWMPEEETDKRKMIWIPDGDQNGEFVNPEDCVIHDKDNLFSSKFYVLERYYEKDLLPFFSSALRVRSNPQVDDYIELWKEWENSVEQFSHYKCCKFWSFILKHNTKKTKEKLFENLKKLPVTSDSSGILLSNKSHVFVADNLYMKNLFEDERVFVWYPQPSLPSLDRFVLLDIYKEIGVCPISKSVQKEESFRLDGVELNEVEPRIVFIGKSLVKLILGFLACSSLKMEEEKRHEAVRGLLDLKVYEMTGPITVNYSLSLSSGRTITREANKMMRWENSELIIQKLDLKSGNASMIKYATYFSEMISAGILCEHVDHVGALSELIKLGFLLKFDEEAVNFLMESKDLQIFLEDEEFLNAAFPSKQACWE